MDKIIIFKIIEIILFVALFFYLLRIVKKDRKVFLWNIVGYVLLVIITIPNYLNINLKYWQIQTIFPITIILLVVIGYKVNKAELEYKKNKKNK